MYHNLKKLAEIVEDGLLEKRAQGIISDYQIETVPDDFKIEVTQVMNLHPVKNIKVDLKVGRALDN